MKLEVLEHIVDNDDGFILALAKEKSIDGSASLGVAKVLIGNGGDTTQLSGKQKYHYENCIRPLIENVKCEGVLQDGLSCASGNDIDDESLLLSYQEHVFQCQHCRYDADKHGL